MVSQRSSETSKDPATDTLKLITLAMDIPILVAIFAYIGYIVGKKYEPQGVFFGILIGGLLGLFMGIISILKVTRALEKRELEKESKQQEI